ncbi:MAG: hypothetical protein V8R75_02650 [Oscillospiraceae bacterium]
MASRVAGCHLAGCDRDMALIPMTSGNAELESYINSTLETWMRK